MVSLEVIYLLILLVKIVADRNCVPKPNLIQAEDYPYFIPPTTTVTIVAS